MARNGPRPHLQHAAVSHDGHAVGEREGFFLVVSDVDGRDAQLLLEPSDLRAHLDPDLGVEVRERLVEEQDVGVEHEGAGQGHPLLLAARELAGVARLEAREVDLGEALAQAALHLSSAELFQLEPIRDIARHRHMGPERVVLEDHADIPLVGGEAADHPVPEADLPRVGLVESGQEPQQGGLAAARRAQQREQLAVTHGEVRPVHRSDGAEPLDDLPDANVHVIETLVVPYFFLRSSHLTSMSLRNRVLSASERLAATTSS